MAGQQKKADLKAVETKPKRKMLTAAEKIAKLHAEAKEIEEREAAKLAARRPAIVEALDKARARAKDAATKVEDLERELKAIDEAAGGTPEAPKVVEA